MRMAKVFMMVVLLILVFGRSASGQSGIYPAGKRHLYIHCEGERAASSDRQRKVATYNLRQEGIV
jgi:hypothetical protein